jgi:hypothetical protein
MTIHAEISFILAGLAVYLVGAIWVLILALRQSIWWLLICLFIPVAAFLFIIFYWPSTKFPLLFKLGGSALIIGGVLALRFWR